MRKGGLVGNALLPSFLFGVKLFLDGSDRAHVNGTEVLGLVEVLVERVGRVDRLKFLGRIFALHAKLSAPGSGRGSTSVDLTHGIFQNNLGPAGMFWRVG